MADNTVLNTGTGGDTIATDDVAGVKYQRVKISVGADGAAADNSTTAPLATKISDGTDVALVDASGNLQVSLSGTAANGTAVKVDGSAVTQPVSIAATVTVDASGTTVPVNSELTTADLDTGAGTDTRAVVGLVGAKSGGGVLIPGDATKGLAVDLTATGANTTALKVDGSAVTQPISAASLPLPTGAATAAKQPALGTAGTASADVITVQGIASMTPVKVDGSGVTQPVSGTVGVSGTVTVDSELTTGDLDTGAGTDTRAVVGLVLAESGGGLLVGSAHPIPISDNSGSLTVDNGGTFAVQAAQSGTWTVQPGNTANTTAWKVDGSAVTQPVSDGGGTISIDDGAGNISVDWAGTVPPIGAGTEAAALRVTVATDSTGVLSVDDNGASLTVDGTVAATQSGTWTVQPGNTANTTAWKVDASSVAVPVTDNSGSLTVDNGGTFAVQASAATSGGASPSLNSIKATATSVKASAGQVYGWFIYNSNSSVAYVQFFDVASGSVTLGTTTPNYSIGIPATSAANVFVPTGIAHGTAITIAATTTVSGSTAPTNNVDINVFYK